MKTSILSRSVQHTLYVQFTHDARASIQLKMINEHGRLVLDRTVEAGAVENVVAVPVSNLPPGNYDLTLWRDGAPLGQTRVIKI